MKSNYLPCFRGQYLQFFSSFVASLGIFSFGVAHLWPAPALPKLLYAEDRLFNITSDQGSWIASIEMLTVPVSSFITIHMANTWGTRNILVIAPLPVILSWILIIFAENVIYYYIARFLVGISEAFFYNCAPIYISEISDPKVRGRLLCLVPLMFNAGGCVVYYFGYTVSLKMFAIISIAPCLLYLAFCLAMPQSPYYCIQKKRYKEARHVLEVLDDKILLDDEFDTFKDKVESEMATQGSLKELFSTKSSRKALTMVLMIMVVQNCVGYATISTYLHFILNASNVNVEVIAFFVALVTTLSCLCTTFFIDRNGRRPLLLFSTFGASLFIFLLGVIFFLVEFDYYRFNPMLFNWIVGFLLMAYIFCLNLGLVNMPFSLAGELFTADLKNYGVSLVLIMYGVAGFISIKLFQVITDHWGMWHIFIAFGITGMLGLFYIYLCIPETRNKSLFEIHQMLEGGKSHKKDSSKIEPTTNDT